MVERPLPSFIPPNKRMSDTELAKKKTGLFVTGLPAFSSDPVNGIGAAFNGFLYFNADRADPLFAYTPYRAKAGINLQHTTGTSSQVGLNLDAPYVYDSPWRVKLDLKFENDPNKLFFGLTEATLDPLPGGSYGAYNQAQGAIRPGAKPGEAAEVTDALYHRFREREFMGNAKFERSIFDGNTRLLMGYELQHLSYQTFQGQPYPATDPATGQKREVPSGQARLDQAVQSGEVFGTQGGVVSLIQTGMIYDTRDFEPDPTRGVVLEAANEFSNPVIGSQFAFDKLFFQAKGYHRLFPQLFERTVFATRIGYGTIFGAQAPFFEYQDQWSTEGSINALGGAQTLRGYKVNRFLGRTVAFANLEVRHKLAEVDVFNQNLSFSLVPFVDLGAIGDRLFLVRLDQPRASAGAGLRIGWNRSTIVLMDFAASPEDQQFFINFNRSY